MGVLAPCPCQLNTKEVYKSVRIYFAHFNRQKNPVFSFWIYLAGERFVYGRLYIVDLPFGLEMTTEDDFQVSICSITNINQLYKAQVLIIFSIPTDQ